MSLYHLPCRQMSPPYARSLAFSRPEGPRKAYMARPHQLLTKVAYVAAELRSRNYILKSFSDWHLVSH